MDAHAGEIDLKVVENVYEVADIEPALMDFADQGYDVVFGHGFQFMEPIVKVAPNYSGHKIPAGNRIQVG